MEWLVLVLLVPAILVPVVLLWGFAGCKFTPPVVGPSKPTDVRAEGISPSAIRVTWNNPDPGSFIFHVKRTKQGESTSAPLVSTTTTLLDAGPLEEATTYFYQVKAIRLSDNIDSSLSEQAAGRTIGVAFEAGLTTNQQLGLEGFCVVQRIEPARLRQSTLSGDIATLGARVRITVRGSTVANLVLDRIFISRPAASGDPYDSAADLTPVASNVSVPANTAVVLPLIDYDLDRNTPLLIACDISATAGSGNIRFVTGVPATEATMYSSANTVQASLNDRSTGYLPSASISLVEKIEVV